MQQLTKTKLVLYHLYPRVLITLCFVILAPVLVKYHYPPQLGFLVAIIIAAIPILVTHLLRTKKKERKKSVWDCSLLDFL